jgi:hypothetical protein
MSNDDDLCYPPQLWGALHDRIWALREASKPNGFFPHAQSVGELMRHLEGFGLVHESSGPTFFITEKGRSELSRWEAEVAT